MHCATRLKFCLLFANIKSCKGVQLQSCHSFASQVFCNTFSVAVSVTVCDIFLKMLNFVLLQKLCKLIYFICFYTFK